RRIIIRAQNAAGSDIHFHGVIVFEPGNIGQDKLHGVATRTRNLELSSFATQPHADVVTSVAVPGPAFAIVFSATHFDLEGVKPFYLAKVDYISLFEAVVIDRDELHSGRVGLNNKGICAFSAQGSLPIGDRNGVVASPSIYSQVN